MTNIYYQPEKFGLEQIAFEDIGEAYSFDMRVVWIDWKTGVMYTARDQGCSCPSPFEGYHAVEELDRVDEGCIKMLEQEGILDTESMDGIKLLYKDYLNRDKIGPDDNEMPAF